MIKHLLQYYAGLIALCAMTSLIGKQVATPFYSIRSQSENSARELIEWAHEVNLYRPGSCDRYGTFATTFEYSGSFGSRQIARCLLGDDCFDGCECPTITISGSEVKNRGSHDWLADYFGLPTDFESRITLEPRIQNYSVDFNWYCGLDNWYPGLYFRVHAPVVYSRWSLNYCETVDNRGELDQPVGYFAPQTSEAADNTFFPRRALLDSFSQYVTDCKVPRLSDGLNMEAFDSDVRFVASFEPLKYSKWAAGCTRLKKTALSDIQIAFGCNFLQCDNYHFGLNVRGAIPTGNRPEGLFFFEPIVGNGHHWELGGGVTAHYSFQCGCDTEREIGLYFDANITHLIRDRQYRIFDLKNGCNSRYMIAMQVGTPVENLVTTLSDFPEVDDTGTAPSLQFQHHYIPIANLTRTLVDVSVAVQADVTAMINYRSSCGDWEVDLGYNFWGRSCETIKINPCDNCGIPLAEEHRWVLKGTAPAYYYSGAPQLAAVPVSSSESTATIHDGAVIDNQQCARDIGGANLQKTINVNSFCVPDQDDPLNCCLGTSKDPITLSVDDLDLDGARTRGISHKIFGFVSHSWEKCGCYDPYVGIGANVEFGGTRSGKGPFQIETDASDTALSGIVVADIDDSCKRCALSQWGLWFKVGLSYD